MRRVALCLALTLLAGCQSYDDAVRLFCEAHVECKQCADVEPGERGSAWVKYAGERISNSEMKALFASIATMSVAERDATMHREAKKAGLARCDLIEAMEEDRAAAKKPLSPND